MFFKRKQNKMCGYPTCDHLNNALRRLLQAPVIDEYVITEICWAIKKSGWSFKNDVKKMLSDGGFWYFKNEKE